MAADRELDDLLAQAREADPGDRILLRDPIAAHGELAIEAMVDWLGDTRLAAFAIRVLERIGREIDQRPAVIAALASVDRGELPAHLIGDLDAALAALGSSTSQGRRAGSTGAPTSRPPGSPGMAGRGYWVMRTSPRERPFIWAEAKHGRLRQGWGAQDEQNLELIAAALRLGTNLTVPQQEARRALRMLTSWEDGMRFGDIVVAPNLPEYGRLSVFRVAGSYEWSPVPPRQFSDRFGHVLPVELVEADIDRHGLEVSDGLRSILRVQTRLYNISGYGGDVERLIGGDVSSDRWGEVWAEADYEKLFGRYPPSGLRPSVAEVDALAAELGRTPDAILWQWTDGAAYCDGRSASTTSEALKSWLDREGLCR